MRVAFNNMNRTFAGAAVANVGHEFWRTVEAFRRIRGGMQGSEPNSRFQILRNFRTNMKTSTLLIRQPEEFGCSRQIVAHIGGMTRAWLRHRPIHFVFHWHGICRALMAGLLPASQAADPS